MIWHWDFCGMLYRNSGNWGMNPWHPDWIDCLQINHWDLLLALHLVITRDIALVVIGPVYEINSLWLSYKTIHSDSMESTMRTHLVWSWKSGNSHSIIPVLSDPKPSLDLVFSWCLVLGLKVFLIVCAYYSIYSAAEFQESVPLVFWTGEPPLSIGVQPVRAVVHWYPTNCWVSSGNTNSMLPWVQYTTQLFIANRLPLQITTCYFEMLLLLHKIQLW